MRSAPSAHQLQVVEVEAQAHPLRYVLSSSPLVSASLLAAAEGRGAAWFVGVVYGSLDVLPDLGSLLGPRKTLVTLCVETCSYFCPRPPGLERCVVSLWLGVLTSSRGTWRAAGAERLRKGLVFLQSGERCLDNVPEIASSPAFPGPCPSASPLAGVDTSSVSSDCPECPVLLSCGSVSGLGTRGWREGEGGKVRSSGAVSAVVWPSAAGCPRRWEGEPRAERTACESSVPRH